jgi:hypothetical protein
MRGVRRSGAGKLHWARECNALRGEVIRLLASLSVPILVVVRACEPYERQERRRRLCLERALLELHGRGVRRLVLESRGNHDDLRDRSLIEALRSRKVLQQTPEMIHKPGKIEPLLWIPDAICGAVGQALRGNDGFLRDLLVANATEIITFGAEQRETPGPTVRRDLPGFASNPNA